MKIAFIITLCAAGLVFVQACSKDSDEGAAIVVDDAEHTEIVKRDLFAIISLQGSPCQQVINYEVQNELDYVATCATGNRYRVHVSSEGMVHVNTHDDTE